MTYDDVTRLEVVTGFFFWGAEVGTVANAWRFCEDHHDR
jgi:hypothetical protein